MDVASKSNGYTFIELMVSILILSVGFVAAASMQINGVRLGSEAYQRTQAAIVANEMADRLRTNHAGLNAGYYDNKRTGSSYSNPGCSTKPCNSKSQAEQDLYIWSNYLLAGKQPDGTQTVPLLATLDGIQPSGDIIPLNNNLYQIRIQWAEIIAGQTTRKSYSVYLAVES